MPMIHWSSCIRPSSLVVACVALAACSGAAQELPSCFVRGEAGPSELAERPSPLDSASVSLGDGALKICYGAPSARGREIVGDLVPFNSPWRGGANEATALHVTTPVEVGGVRLEPGSYAVWFVPGEAEWEVVFQDEHERWGVPIPQGGVVGRTSVPAGSTDSMVERLTYGFETGAEGGPILVMEWETTRLEIPVGPM